jgi:ketosteroid isomerase-like protein
VDREALLRKLYVAFNERDIDAVLARLHPEVDWPNAWEGGRLHGHDAVRDYWQRQWAEIDPTVEPVGFSGREDGRLAVAVHQTVRDREGNLLAENDVTHLYAFRDGQIAAMDVVEGAG